jgi:glycosyltransferase EpsH
MPPPLVSVIIPVFNTRPYLQQCLDSLIAQTLKPIEIICVDNGSIDGSYEFLKEYAEVHSNMIVMKHPEGRQGGARNAGIEIARGNYIGFVDSDDFVSPDMFQLMHETAEAETAQVVVCNTQYYHIDSGYGGNSLPKSVLDTGSPAPIQQRLILLRNLTICNKLFSRKLIENHGIRFPQGSYHEDQFFVIAAMVSASRISTIPTPLYFYRRGRPGSVNESHGPDCLHIFTIMDKVVSFVEQHQQCSLLHEIIREVKVMKILQVYHLAGPEYQRSYYIQMKKQLKSANLENSYQLLTRSERREYQLVCHSGHLIFNLYLTLRAKYGELRKYIARFDKALSTG